jgi:hypothetical protein
VIYDDLADRLTSEYGLLLFALFGRYQSMQAPGVEITPKALVDLQVDAYALGRAFYDIAKTEIDAYLRPMHVGDSEELDVALTHRKQEVLTLVRKMVVENVQQVTKLGRTGLGDYSRLIRDAHSATGLLIQRKVGTIDFKTTDTSDRKWDAKTLMRVVIRDFGYQSWLDTQFDEILASGTDLATAYRNNESGIDMTFSITGDTPGYEALDDIRSRIFHPNSTLLVKAYVPS